MKTISVNVYSITELADEARAKVLDEWREPYEEYTFNEDAAKSLHSFLDYWDAECTGWSVEFDNAPRIASCTDYEPEELIELAKSMPSQPTGYYLDTIIADEIAKLVAKGEVRSLPQLVNAGITAWWEAVREDYEWLRSDESITDTLMDDEVYYFANGEEVPASLINGHE